MYKISFLRMFYKIYEIIYSEILLNKITSPLNADNAPEFKSKSVLAILRKYMIARHNSEPHHPNQDLAERCGGMLKAATTHLLLVTGAPLTYWCFALEFVAHARTVLARRSIGWQTPHEKMFHETPDISMFRFPFYCPIWFYTPRATFPHQKMMPARFLGIERRAGNSFCFLIVTEPADESTNPQFLVRSVICRRFPQQDAPRYPDTTTTSTLTFYRNDEKTPPDDPADWEEEYAMPSVFFPANSEELSSSNDPVDQYNLRFREVYGYDPPDSNFPDPTSISEPTTTVDEVSNNTSNLPLDNTVSELLPTDNSSEEMCSQVLTTDSIQASAAQSIVQTVPTPPLNSNITEATTIVQYPLQ